MPKKTKKGKARPKKGKAETIRDRHYLYSAAVQSVDADAEFFRKVYRKKRGKEFLRFREDFCGTAVLACEWVRSGSDHEAWGVDLDEATLDWGRRHYVPRLGEGASRLHLLCEDVLEAEAPPVDLVAALNFSYSVFKTREQLRAYFEAARRSLRPDGLFVIDAWGGTEAMEADLEKRRIAAEVAFDGTKVPSFTYVWDQKRFNPVDHQMLCHIHFHLKDGTKLKRAFTYDWRLWMLPELRELLAEAGFRSTEVYVEGWDDENEESDGVFRRKKYFENQAGWVAYVVGIL